jgi:hypothetical protein
MNKAKRMTYTENKEGVAFRGKGFKKERWYSICSAHMNYDKDCPRCKTGSWHNVWLVAISGWFHDHIYWLWYFWVNYI